MRILSHRGYWKSASDKNTSDAFIRSFKKGFGTETDFRDCNGRLVIAHNLPIGSPMLAEDFFKVLNQIDNSLPIAINIKADGLQPLFIELLGRFNIKNYFLFDMSVPDAIQSIKCGLHCFTRHSDFEPVPAFYRQADGVWMDAFVDHSWITPEAIMAHLEQGKEVCLVSPELHKRPHEIFWERLRCSGIVKNKKLMLCSDIPEEACLFFNND